MGKEMEKEMEKEMGKEMGKEPSGKDLGKDPWKVRATAGTSSPSGEGTNAGMRILNWCSHDSGI